MIAHIYVDTGRRDHNRSRFTRVGRDPNKNAKRRGDIGWLRWPGENKIKNQQLNSTSRRDNSCVCRPLYVYILEYYYFSATLKIHTWRTRVVDKTITNWNGRVGNQFCFFMFLLTHAPNNDVSGVTNRAIKSSGTGRRRAQCFIYFCVLCRECVFFLDSLLFSVFIHAVQTLIKFKPVYVLHPVVFSGRLQQWHPQRLHHFRVIRKSTNCRQITIETIQIFSIWMNLSYAQLDSLLTNKLKT